MYKIILLILLIIVFVWLFTKEKFQENNSNAVDLVNKIEIVKSNRDYRIADVFYKRGFKFKDSINNLLSKEEFQNTILVDYLNLTYKEGENDFRKIVRHNSEEDNEKLINKLEESKYLEQNIIIYLMKL